MLNGAPTVDEYRCKKIKKNGERCGNWALRGIGYCRCHGGAGIRAIKEKSARSAATKMAKSRFYSNHLSPKLRALVEDALDAPHHEQLCLKEELSITRAYAAEAHALLSAVETLPDNHPNKQAAIAAAQQIAQQSIDAVVRCGKAASEVDSASKDKFSLSAIYDIVSQITRAVHYCFEDCSDGMLRFDEWLNTELKLPTMTAQGTSVTPDQDAHDMDSTVPAAPDVDPNTTEY